MEMVAKQINVQMVEDIMDPFFVCFIEDISSGKIYDRNKFTYKQVNVYGSNITKPSNGYDSMGVVEALTKR